jgi:hypothetical protein
MVARKKIDSNETELAYAEEESLGVLPVTPVWVPQEPNSYDDLGGELTLLARNPINSSRQRKKGAITDLDASGGYNQDFTLSNTPDLLQGVMFADYRRKLNSAVTAVTATGYAVADETGFTSGQLVFASGFTDTANNGVHTVTGTSAGEVTVAGLVVEAFPPAGAKIEVVGVVGTAGTLDIDASGTWPRLTSSAIDFTDYDIIPGEWLFIGGDAAGTFFTNAANNGFKRVRSVAAGYVEFDQSEAVMVTEPSTTETIAVYMGRVLKNETGALIKRRSYQIERKLGAPDTASANVQSEYLIGAVPGEFTMTIEQADKINCDIAFVAIDNEQRTATEGLKAGTRATLQELDAFNTSSDFATMRLSINTPGNEAPGALFGYLTELSLSINNNLSVNKAVAVLGGFDITAGTFEVMAEATAYFSTVEAVAAVRNNENVQLYAAVAKENAGFVVDLPLIALGNARLNVEQDEPITLPLTMDAATASKLNPETDYTLLWVFFDYLPNRAEA